MSDAGDFLIASKLKIDDLRAAITRLHADAERNARSGSLDYDERTRWRRFAAQLSEALK